MREKEIGIMHVVITSNFIPICEHVDAWNLILGWNLYTSVFSSSNLHGLCLAVLEVTCFHYYLWVDREFYSVERSQLTTKER